MSEIDTKEFAYAIGEYVLEKKASNVSILDFDGKNDFADFFVLATVDSDPQVTAVADHITQNIKENYQLIPHHREGIIKQSSWFIIDYIDVIVHLFKPDEREKYSLEKLWVNAEVIQLSDDKEDDDNLY